MLFKKWLHKFIFILLAELGDFDPLIHTAAFVSEFRFVPVETEEIEVEIRDFYKHLK